MSASLRKVVSERLGNQSTPKALQSKDCKERAIFKGKSIGLRYKGENYDSETIQSLLAKRHLKIQLNFTDLNS